MRGSARRRLVARLVRGGRVRLQSSQTAKTGHGMPGDWLYFCGACARARAGAGPVVVRLFIVAGLVLLVVCPSLLVPRLTFLVIRPVMFCSVIHVVVLFSNSSYPWPSVLVAPNSLMLVTLPGFTVWGGCVYRATGLV